MKHTNLIAAVSIGASFALAAPTLAKDPVQSLANSFDAVAHVFLKSANISVPGAGPEPTRNLVPIDGALVKARGDPSDIICVVSESNGHPYRTPVDKVRKNIEQLRGRSDKPPTVAAGDCDLAICADSSGIDWCANSGDFTADSWGMLADAAQAALDDCSSKTDDGLFDATVLYDNVWFAGVSSCNK